MKHFITLITIFISMVFSINANAQLSMQSAEDAFGYTTVFKIPMGYGEIRYIDGGYFLMGVTDNRFEDSMASIYLGVDKESVCKSLEDLQMIKSEKPKESIYVKGFKQRTTTILNAGPNGMAFCTDGVAGVSYALSFLKIEKAIISVESFIEPK